MGAASGLFRPALSIMALKFAKNQLTLISALKKWVIILK